MNEKETELLENILTADIVAFRRQKRDCVAIGALNLLLGWTLIGWAASLVWALKND